MQRHSSRENLAWRRFLLQGGFQFTFKRFYENKNVLWTCTWSITLSIDNLEWPNKKQEDRSLSEHISNESDSKQLIISVLLWWNRGKKAYYICDYQTPPRSLKGYVTAWKLLLRPINKKKRLLWAKKHKSWIISQ